MTLLLSSNDSSPAELPLIAGSAALAPVALRLQPAVHLSQRPRTGGLVVFVASRSREARLLQATGSWCRMEPQCQLDHPVRVV